MMNDIRKRAEALLRVIQDAALPIGAIELALQAAFDDGYRTRNPGAALEKMKLDVIESAERWRDVVDLDGCHPAEEELAASVDAMRVECSMRGKW